MDGLASRGFNAFLATPSGAKPRWMSEKYPETRRIDAEGRREPHGERHNHCLTSPVYREKVRLINSKLADRYSRHQALALWHISNEYSGACYCDYCLGASADFLSPLPPSRLANKACWSSFCIHVPFLTRCTRARVPRSAAFYFSRFVPTNG